MLELSADLDRLDHLLSALPLDAEAMLLSELDGFLAGLLILPEPVGEAEWLPHIWNHFPLAGPETEIAAEIGRIAQLRKTEIALGFQQGGLAYDPVCDLDTDGSVLWEIWFEGYERAVGLQHQIYDTLIEDGDEDVRKAITGLVWVSLAAHGELEDFKSKARRKELHQLIAQILPGLVETLYRRRHGLDRVAPNGGSGWEASDEEDGGDRYAYSQEPVRVGKIGRNQPCPCGSGKKYKKCCGR